MTRRHNPLSWIDDELTRLERDTLLRRLETRTGAQGATIRLDGRELVNFGSNDYLGLAGDPRLAEAALRAAHEEGWGAGASPLLAGRSAAHRELEERLAAFEGTEAALAFSSGFAANAGVVAALAGRGDAIFADESNHASLIDGCRLSRAEVHVYPHGDADRLEQLLRGAAGYRRRLIVSDSLFSMDGDAAPLAQLAELAERYECMLLLDEAHATGVFGIRGRGLAEDAGIEDRVAARVGTLSKALGSVGGFVAGSRALVDWLLNRARPYVFSTAPPAACCAAATAAINIVVEQPQRRESLLRQAAILRAELTARGWNIGASASQIVPVIVGPATAAMELAARLRAAGLFVPAIRPPSVPEGTSRLRISLSSQHTTEMTSQLIEAIGQPA